MLFRSIAALVLSKHGTVDFTSNDLRKQITTSINDFYFYNPSVTGLYGSGYIDAAKALVINNIPSSINANSLNTKVEVYPNPVAETLFVTCNFSIKKTTYKLYATNGSKVYDSTEDTVQGELKAINVATLAKGVYILQITNENGSTTHRIVKR